MYHTTLYFRVLDCEGAIICYCATKGRAQAVAERFRDTEIEEYRHGHGWTVV